jgi:serine/threonine protein kinase
LLTVTEREKLFVDLLTALLAYHPDRRLTATEAWNHPFLRVID